MERSLVTTAAVVGVVSAIFCATPARAGSYVFTTLDLPGSAETSASALNASNLVVGQFRTRGPTSHYAGFVWSNGTYTVVDRLKPGQRTGLFGVNDAGVAVGTRDGKGLVYDTRTGAATAIDLAPGHPGAISSLTGINDHGQMVGTYFVPGQGGDPTRAVLVDHGTITELSPPGASGSYVWALNQAGTVLASYATSCCTSQYFTFANGQRTLLDLSLTGYALAPDGRVGGEILAPSGAARGFVLKGSRVATVDYPGAQRTLVTAIRGTSVYGDADALAFVKHGATFQPIVAPDGGYATGIAAVNAVGSLLGGYSPSPNVFRAFIATCAPDQEPCTP